MPLPWLAGKSALQKVVAWFWLLEVWIDFELKLWSPLSCPCCSWICSSCQIIADLVYSLSQLCSICLFIQSQDFQKQSQVMLNLLYGGSRYAAEALINTTQQLNAQVWLHPSDDCSYVNPSAQFSFESNSAWVPLSQLYVIPQVGLQRSSLLFSRLKRPTTLSTSSFLPWLWYYSVLTACCLVNLAR